MDIWSLGIVLYSMLTANSRSQPLRDILRKGKFSCPEHVSQGSYLISVNSSECVDLLVSDAPSQRKEIRATLAGM